MSAVWRLLDPHLVQRLNRLHVPARLLTTGSTIGSHRSPLKGASIEFRQHRFYVSGDDPRRLDWRVFARTDRPYIKEFDEQTSLRAALLVDVSGSMGYTGEGRPGKLLTATRVAAALGYVLLQADESVGVALCDQGMSRWLPPARGTPQLARMIDVLERAVASPRALDVESLAGAAAERMESRSLLVLISDALAAPEAWSRALARLRHDRHQVVLVRILDPDEVELPFDGPVRFRGLEQEPAQLLDVTLLRQHYRRRFERHGEQLRQLCAAQAVRLVEVRVDRDLLRQLWPLFGRGKA